MSENDFIPGSLQYVRKIQNEEINKAQKDKDDPFHTFYSLVQPYQKPKKRNCLKCQRTMTSEGSGNRICSHCKSVVVGSLGMM